MSVRHIAAVIDSDLKRSHRGVAMVYANSANDEDNVVALSARKVAAGSGYGDRQAIALTDELEKIAGTCGRPVLQFIAWDDLPEAAAVRLAAIPKRRRPKPYLMHMGCKNCTPLTGDGVQKQTPKGAKTDADGVQAVAPEPEEKPEKNPWHAHLRYSPPADWEPNALAHTWTVPSTPEEPSRKVDLLWEALVDVCRIEEATLTKPARKAANVALAELRGVDADPREIQTRAARYRRGQGSVPAGSTLTPHALVNHWAGCAPPPAADPINGHEHRWSDDSTTDTDPLDHRGRWCINGGHFENPTDDEGTD